MNIRFEYDSEKATHVVLYFLQKFNGSLDKLKLIKLVFLADIAHLEKYGRPITGGVYKALKHGPVLMDLLNDINSTQIDDSGDEAIYKLTGHDVTSTESPDTDYFSPSDIQILDEIFDRHGNVDKWDLEKLTHTFKLYRKNWKSGTSAKSFLIPYEDFFEDCKDNGMLPVIKERQCALAELGC